MWHPLARSRKAERSGLDDFPIPIVEFPISFFLAACVARRANMRVLCTYVVTERGKKAVIGRLNLFILMGGGVSL